MQHIDDDRATHCAGLATSPHPLATAAGTEVLEKGGNAIDAAVAIGGVLSVVSPHFCGLGGDAVWMIADAEGSVDCILGLGQAAGDVSGVARDGRTIPLRGGGSTLATAGCVDSWGLALDHAASHWGGTGRLGELLAPAAEIAEAGFALPPSQIFWLDFRAGEFASWPGFERLFVPGGRRPQPGETFRQPELAATIRTIMDRGAREFYEGELAQRMAKALAERGSPLKADDLAATRARLATPLSVGYRDTMLFAPPPPTQGLTMLMTMGILDALDPSGWQEGSPEHFHLVVEAIKQAFLERSAIGDPDFSPVDVARLLSRGWREERARAIDTAHALAWPQVFQHGDTVYFGAVDREGRCVSVLQSTYFDWGSGVVVGDTGIIWNNRGAAFSLDPDSPNCLAPGKRPFHTLNPGLALRNGRPHLLYGTQGADGQPQTLALLLTRLIDFGLAPSQALERPRFLLGRTFSDTHDCLKIEADAGEGTMAALRTMGHEISPLPPQSPIAGLAGVIRIDDGIVLGAHDPRGEPSGTLARSADRERSPPARG